MTGLSKFLRAPVGAAFRAAARLNLALYPREYRYIFILSPRRSGSTVLSHILNSHPNIMGAGETYTTYSAAADLNKLVPRTCQLLRKLYLESQYVVDKITMDKFLKADDILSSPLIYKCIILIRSPEGSLQSLISQYGIDEDTALGEYVGRLETLARYGRVLGKRATLLEYNDLIDRTDEALGALTRFLAVDPPLTSNYIVHRGTGKLGDSSENIFRGKVIRTSGHENKISAEVMSAASTAFHKYRDQLRVSTVPLLLGDEGRV